MQGYLFAFDGNVNLAHKAAHSGAYTPGSAAFRPKITHLGETCLVFYPSPAASY